MLFIHVPVSEDDNGRWKTRRKVGLDPLRWRGGAVSRKRNEVRVVGRSFRKKRSRLPDLLHLTTRTTKSCGSQNVSDSIVSISDRITLFEFQLKFSTIVFIHVYNKFIMKSHIRLRYSMNITHLKMIYPIHDCGEYRLCRLFEKLLPIIIYSYGNVTYMDQISMRRFFFNEFFKSFVQLILRPIISYEYCWRQQFLMIMG